MVWNEKLKREIPIGWNGKTLKECVEHITTGLNPRDNFTFGGDIKYITVKNLTNDGALDFNGCDCIDNAAREKVHRRSQIQIGDVLYASICPLGRTYLIITSPNDWDINESVFSIRPNLKVVSSIYLNILLKDTYYITKLTRSSTGSIFQGIRIHELERTELLVPSWEIIEAFGKVLFPIIKEQDERTKEISVLVKQRDELLPLLMNGQVNSDLIAHFAVYCRGQQNPNNMKEKIIDNVLAAMQSALDCQQMKLLKVTLQEQLHNVSVTIAEQSNTNNNLDLLETFISAKRIEGCSERSLRYYHSSIEQFFLFVELPITQIDTALIRNYLARYQAERKCSKVTIDNMRRILSSFFGWLEDEDYIIKSPVRRIHKVKTDSLVRETLSDEQLEQLRDQCDNARDLAIIDMLSSTGMRVGELVKLNRQDVNFEERQCVVFGKGNKERIVYFNARTKIHLQAYLAGRTDNNKALFVSIKAPYQRLQISGVERRIKKLGQSVQINRVHPHKFRRTLATVAIDKGMPIEQVQRLLGHVRIDTTLHYAMVSQQNVKMSHKKYLS
jgi:site-specific recombinase XerD